MKVKSSTRLKISLSGELSNINKSIQVRLSSGCHRSDENIIVLLKLNAKVLKLKKDIFRRNCKPTNEVKFKSNAES